MGTDIGNTTENLRLLHNPTVTRDNPHLHPHKTHPPDNQTDLSGRRNTGLPVISTSTFFPTVSENKYTWWEERTGESTNVKIPQHEQIKDDSGDSETEYVWDSSDEQEEGDTKTTVYVGTRWVKKTGQT